MSTLYGKSCWSAMRGGFLAITRRLCPAPHTRHRDWIHFDRLHSWDAAPVLCLILLGSGIPVPEPDPLRTAYSYHRVARESLQSIPTLRINKQGC